MRAKQYCYATQLKSAHSSVRELVISSKACVPHPIPIPLLTKTVLASSLKLEYPLTNDLPSTTHARDRLLAKIFKYRSEVASEEGEEGNIVAKDEDYEILYAYTLVTGQLSEEIQKVEKDVEELFGILDEELLKLQ